MISVSLQNVLLINVVAFITRENKIVLFLVINQRRSDYCVSRVSLARVKSSEGRVSSHLEMSCILMILVVMRQKQKESLNDRPIWT